MATRSRKKEARDTLRVLCEEIIERVQESELNIGLIVSSYVKLSDLRDQLTDLEGELQAGSNVDDLKAFEGIDQRCLKECELLFNRLPAEHPLRMQRPPLHLAHVLPASGDNNEGSTLHSQFKIPEFDGKKSEWPLFKLSFQKRLSHQTSLDADSKFLLLLSALKKDSFPYKMIYSYLGTSEAYDLAWQSLTSHYDLTWDLKRNLLKDLRDLGRTHRVSDSSRFAQLDRLYTAVETPIKALKAARVPPHSFESLALIGLEEALPGEFRTELYKVYTEEDSDSVKLDKALRFLKNEAVVRRRSYAVEDRQASNQGHVANRAPLTGGKKPSSRQPKSGKNKGDRAFVQQSDAPNEELNE